MAVNAKMGPIVAKVTEDPNGTPGQTSGGVPPTVSHQRTPGLPNAGSNAAIPPFNQNPTLDPLADVEFAAPPVGPNQ